MELKSTIFNFKTLLIMSCSFSENNHPLGSSLRDLTPAGRPFQQVCLDTWGEEHLLPYQSPGHNCDPKNSSAGFLMLHRM